MPGIARHVSEVARVPLGLFAGCKGHGDQDKADRDEHKDRDGAYRVDDTAESGLPQGFWGQTSTMMQAPATEKSAVCTRRILEVSGCSCSIRFSLRSGVPSALLYAFCRIFRVMGEGNGQGRREEERGRDGIQEEADYRAGNAEDGGDFLGGLFSPRRRHRGPARPRGSGSGRHHARSRRRKRSPR